MESPSVGTDGEEVQDRHDERDEFQSSCPPAFLADQIPTLRRIAATLPLFACCMSLTTTLLSFLYSPNTASQWDRLHDTGFNEVKQVWVVDEARCNAFRIYRIVVYFSASVCEGWVLKCTWAKLGQTCLFPYLPRSLHMVNLYRPLIAMGNFALLLVGADDAGVNPGLGLYGWTGAYAASGFPQVTGLNSWTHIFLATVGGVTIAVTRVRPTISLSRGCCTLFLRILFAAALCLTPEYFWYDSKHWFGGSHFANLSGEFLPWFSFVAALSQCALLSRIVAAQGAAPDRAEAAAAAAAAAVAASSALASVPPSSARSDKMSRWPWLVWFDRQGCIFAPICVGKTIIDIFRCPGFWEPPSKMPEEVPAGCSFYIGSFDVVNSWRLLFLVLYFSAAVLLFVFSELTLHKEARLRHPSSPPQCGHSSEMVSWASSSLKQNKAMELCGGND